MGIFDKVSEEAENIKTKIEGQMDEKKEKEKKSRKNKK